MKKLALAIGSTLMIASPWCFAATLSSMTQDQINQTFAGKTMTTIPTTLMNNQPQENKFTFYLDNQGKISGKFTNSLGNAPQNDQGTYTVKSDGSLCMTWQKWSNAQETCANVYETANGYLFIDADNNFHTFVMKSDLHSGNQVSV